MQHQHATPVGTKRPRTNELDASAATQRATSLIAPNIVWNWDDDSYGTWSRPARQATFNDVLLRADFSVDTSPRLCTAISGFMTRQSPADGFGATCVKLESVCEIVERTRVVHTIWLPTLLRPASGCIRPAFPSVGLGNKICIYVVNRLAAALLGLRFTAFPLPFHLAPLPSDIDYSTGAAPPLTLAPSEQQEGDGDGGLSLGMPPVPLVAWLDLQRRIGADFVLTRRSQWVHGPLLQHEGAVGAVASWMVPMARRFVAAADAAFGGSRRSRPAVCSSAMPTAIISPAVSAAAAPSAGAAAYALTVLGTPSLHVTPTVARASDDGPTTAPAPASSHDEGGDWVVHLRTGDIWIERGSGRQVSGGGCVNDSYAQPPVWWYAWLARRYRPASVLIVSSNSESSLVQAVDAVLRAAGVPLVSRQAGTPEADFGTLLRARTLVASVSTFAWWAAFLAPFVQEQDDEKDGGAAAAVRVFWPQTGMAHPRSLHHLHARLHLASQPPVRWFDTAAAAAAAAGANSKASCAHTNSPAVAAATSHASAAPVLISAAVPTPACAQSDPAVHSTASAALCEAEAAAPACPWGTGPGERTSCRLDVHAYDLGLCDDWASTAAQQGRILATDPPEWFVGEI
jgi:hypothetical protein